MSLITHVAHNNNIHELVFTESSRSVIDHFLKMMNRFYQQSNGESLYLIMDMRQSGMLPLRYLTKSLRQLLEQHADTASTNIAIVLEDPQMLNVTRALLRTFMHRDSVQYFTDIEKAHLWLQIEQTKHARR